MALNLSTLTKPPSNQVVDPATGIMRQEWIDFFGDLTGQLNSAVGQLGTDKAPANAQYLVGAANSVLTAERVVTDTPSITWDLATAAQAKAVRAALSGDVTAAAGSNSVTVNKVAGLPLSSSGDRWGVMPFVHTDGVMEIGRALDFHNSDASAVDNGGRLRSDDIGTAGSDLSWMPAAGADSGVLKRLVTARNSTLAQGDLLYYDGANFVRLAPGSAGQMLQTAGAGANPAWASPGQQLLASGSVSAAATADIVLTSFTAFRNLMIFLNNIVPATDDTQFFMRTSTNGGSSYDSGASDYVWSNYSFDSSQGGPTAGQNSAAQLGIGTDDGNAKLSSDAGAAASYNIFLPNRTTANKCLVRWQGCNIGTTNLAMVTMGAGFRNTAADVDAIRFFQSSGNISLNYAVYGWS